MGPLFLQSDIGLNKVPSLPDFFGFFERYSFTSIIYTKDYPGRLSPYDHPSRSLFLAQPSHQVRCQDLENYKNDYYDSSGCRKQYS